MNVGSQLLEAQLEHIDIAGEAAAGKEVGRTYFNKETSEILIGDGVNFLRYSASPGTIGSTDYSLLSEAQYQAERDSTWVLFDDRSIVGSDLEILTGIATLGDARGIFLRAANNGRVDGNENPDGTLINEFQDDELQSHSHTISGGTATQPIFTGGNTSNTTGGGGNIGTGSSGGNETRPKSLTMNLFIKINRLP